MLTADDITIALRQHLPTGVHPAVYEAIPALAQVLADMQTTGALKDAQVALQARLTADPNLTAALRALAGQRAEAGASVISFGAGAQLGDVSIGDVAGGNVVKFHLDVHQTIGTQQVINAHAGASIGSMIGAQTNYYTSYSAPIRTPHEQRNRRAMLQKVRAIWIDGLLADSLAKVVRVDLGFEKRPDAISLPFNAQYQELGKGSRELPPQTQIINIFDEAGGSLLILGAPGAGKTTLLLELTLSLLKRAEADEAHPIPVVFNLSTWSIRQKPLDVWLIEELALRYDIPLRLAEAWVRDSLILPMLDGLDEVAVLSRNACVMAINKFCRNKMTPLVVCSRITDYEALTSRLKLYGAVVVRPLTVLQIDAYLSESGAQLNNLRHAIANDQELRELGSTPLMLGVLSLAYADKQTDALSHDRRTLWSAYIASMFHRRSLSASFASFDILRWLRWIASLLLQYNQTILLIEQLPISWFSVSIQREIRRLTRLMMGTIIGVIVGVGLALHTGNARGVIFGVSAGFIVFLLQGLYHTTQKWRIVPSEEFLPRLLGFRGNFYGIYTGLIAAFTTITLSGPYKSRLSQILPTWIAEWFMPLLAYAGLSTFIATLVYSLTLRPGIADIVERLSWSWSGMRQGIGRGTLLGAIGGLGSSIGAIVVIVPSTLTDVIRVSGIYASIVLLTCIVIGALTGGLKHDQVDHRVSPNQGIWRSISYALILGAIAGAVGIGGAFILPTVVVATGNEMRGSYMISVVASVFCITTAMAYGGLTSVYHLAIRMTIARHRLCPWNLVSFLDQCTNRALLRHVGGGYIFIHRLLMEHFAAMTDEDIARLSGEIEGAQGQEGQGSSRAR